MWRAGITFTDSYDTNGVLKASAELTDTPVSGLRAVLDASFSPSGKPATYGTKVSAGYKREYLNVNTTVDVLNLPNVSADVTVGTRDLVVGALFNVRDKTTYDLVLSYGQPDYVVALHARKQLSQLSLSYFHQVDNKLAAGAVATYGLDGKDTKVEAGVSYALDKDASIKVRLDSNARLGFGYTQRLRPGIKATFGADVDSAKGTTQLGFNLNLDA
jgi:voltage-dependent anion channel protein 2